jgi:hypothetical protein
MKLLRVVTIVTVCLYILDAWAWFVPAASILVFLLSLPCFAIASIACFFPKYRRLSLRVMACVGFFFLGVVAVVGTLHIRKTLVERKAVKLGNACLAYHAKYDRYPERLDDLVPEYISSVPAANYGILGKDKFFYSAHDGPQPFIYYRCLPLFGNCYYYVECRCWDFLD